MLSATEQQETANIRTRAVRARRDWRFHRKICRLCAQLSKNRSQYCDDGWALRTELHQAEQILRIRKDAIASGQGTLF